MEVPAHTEGLRSVFTQYLCPPLGLAVAMAGFLSDSWWDRTSVCVVSCETIKGTESGRYSA